MKIKLKSDFSRTLHFEGLTVGKWYETELTPNIYDSMTFHVYRYYMIICDDGYSRRFPLDYFITLEEWRDSELQKILL